MRFKWSLGMCCLWVLGEQCKTRTRWTPCTDVPTRAQESRRTGNSREGQRGSRVSSGKWRLTGDLVLGPDTEELRKANNSERIERKAIVKLGWQNLIHKIGNKLRR